MLEPGEYTVRVTVSGFSAAVQIIRLNQDSNPFFEVILQVAGADSSVTIVDVGGYQTEAIRSATKTLTPLLDIPQSITVVPSEQIKDQMLMSISDVVRYMPGITAHQGENNRDDVVIRGNRSSADFFLNGVRDDVQYYRDLYNLDRVETMKGPNAAIFGRGGGGGVINRVTKEAQFSPLREISFQGVRSPTNGWREILTSPSTTSSRFAPTVFMRTRVVFATLSVSNGTASILHLRFSQEAKPGSPSATNIFMTDAPPIAESRRFRKARRCSD